MLLSKKLAVMKFGGSLIDFSGANIPLIAKRISDIRKIKDLGPVAVFSAPNGVTDKLQAVGDATALGREISVDPIFSSFLGLAAKYLEGDLIEGFQNQLNRHRRDVEEALLKIDRRFDGSARAKVLTSGGELITATLMSYILNSQGLDSCCLDKVAWPIVTNDDFENATPDLQLSRNNLSEVVRFLEDGMVVCVAGFLGMTSDGLETVLGKGGSDQTAVFLSCLLRDRYEVETILLKDSPVQSADPAIVKNQKLQRISTITYNEASKATISGMTIVQNAAVRLARTQKLPVVIAPLRDLNIRTVIQGEDVDPQVVKCVTGRRNCAIVSMRNERSRSIEDCLRLWERYDGFLDLGAEVMDTGQVIRDFLVLDADFVRKNEKRLKSFDEEMDIEYGVGIVTLIGDKMRNSPGVASIAIRSIPTTNIKRGVFSPHTSQIMLVVDEEDVPKVITVFHSQLDKINKV